MVTDQIKILDDKIKSKEAQYDLGREAAKISALSSKHLEKYEYLTGEDLGYKSSVLEKGKFEYSSLGLSLNKAFKKAEVKNIVQSKSDFNHDSNHSFQRFYKGHDELEEMSLASQYNRIKEFDKLVITFRGVKTKKNRNTTQKGANYEKCRQTLQKVL